MSIDTAPSDTPTLVPHQPQPQGVWEPAEHSTGRPLVQAALLVLAAFRWGNVYAKGFPLFMLTCWGATSPTVQSGLAVLWDKRIVLLGTLDGACWLLRPGAAWQDVLWTLARETRGEIAPEALRTAQAETSPPGESYGQGGTQEAPGGRNGTDVWTGGTQPGKLGFNGG